MEILWKDADPRFRSTVGEKKVSVFGGWGCKWSDDE